MGKNLYDTLRASLGRTAGSRFDSIFEKYEVDDCRGKRKVGRVVRAAWQSENRLPNSAMSELGSVAISIVKKRDISKHRTPSCCMTHGDFLRAYPKSAFPTERELLGLLARALWILVPKARGKLRMHAPSVRSRSITVSRLMRLDHFLLNHDRDVIVGRDSVDDAKTRYLTRFASRRREVFRRADLKKFIKNESLVGYIGARKEDNPIDPANPTYCKQRWPFWTPTAGVPKDRGINPEKTLRALGLQFCPKQTFVELVHEVKVYAPRTRSRTATAIPTVVDSEGYWLFRPDRALDSSGMRWNFTRDIMSDGRGREELISHAIKISQLVDLIVWPNPTREAWARVAARSLTNGKYPLP